MSLLIATVLTSSSLIVPSINVYATTTPNVSVTTPKTLLGTKPKISVSKPKILATISKISATISKTSKSSTPSASQTTGSEIQYVDDTVHNVLVAITNTEVTSNSQTYTVGMVLTSNDGVNWTYALAPNMDQFQSIAYDGNGDVVIGSCYNVYTNPNPIEYWATYNYIYTTSDGGQTWAQTASGNRMVDFTTGMYYTGYSGTIYLGRTQSITYSGTQFVATGEYGATFYSSNGYNWHQ